jgi:hypothetical protein
MTKKEALRQTEQENALLNLGFTRDEAEQLRRISMTLHRWHELECGDSNDYASWTIARGYKKNGEFVYDDNGKPFEERHVHTENKARYTPIADRESGARRRLNKIIEARNARQRIELPPEQRADLAALRTIRVSAYIQGDPRGAALYIIRPGDVPEGQNVESYYNRGICVY